MTIKKYNKHFYFIVFLISSVVFLVIMGKSFFSFMEIKSEYDASELKREVLTLNMNISNIKKQITTNKKELLKKKNAILDIRLRERNIVALLNKINEVGRSTQLFSLHLESIRPNIKYINQADVVLSVSSPSRNSNSEIATLILKDTLFNDQTIKKAFNAYKNNFEILGNKIYFTVEKKVKK